MIGGNRYFQTNRRTDGPDIREQRYNIEAKNLLVCKFKTYIILLVEIKFLSRKKELAGALLVNILSNV